MTAGGCGSVPLCAGSVSKPPDMTAGGCGSVPLCAGSVSKPPDMTAGGCGSVPLCAGSVSKPPDMTAGGFGSVPLCAGSVSKPPDMTAGGCGSLPLCAVALAVYTVNLYFSCHKRHLLTQKLKICYGNVNYKNIVNNSYFISMFIILTRSVVNFSPQLKL